MLVIYGSLGALFDFIGEAPYPAAPAGAGGRGALPPPASVRGRVRGADRGGGGLRRRPRAQAARGPQRPCRPRLARRHPDHAVPRHHLPDQRLRHPAARRRDPDLPARPPRLRRRRRLLRDPARHHAHPAAGRQHVLRRLPAAGLLPGPRPVHPPPVRDAGRSAGVLQRHRHPGRAGRPPARALQRRHPRPHPALRGRRVHLLHPVAVEHGPPLAAAAQRGLVVAGGHQRHRRRRHRSGHADHRGDQVLPRRLDRAAAHPDAGDRVPRHPPPLRGRRRPSCPWRTSRRRRR